jgi:hypothetical protein
MPLVHKKLTANFTMTATQLFYETQLLLLMLMRLLQLETDRSKDRGGNNFKDTAAARCQLCKIHQRQICKKTPDRG